MALHLYKFERPSLNNALFLSLVEINHVVLKEKTNMWKVNKRTDRRTDDGQPMKRKAHLRSQLRWHLLFDNFWKMWKVYRRTDTRRTTCDLSFQLRSAKNACYLTTSCLIISGTILFYMNLIRGGEYSMTTNLYNPTWPATHDHRPWSGQMWRCCVRSEWRQTVKSVKDS